MKQKARFARRTLRCKAFIIDLFLLYAPLCYLCYFVLGSGAQFRANQVAIALCSVFFGVIYSAFIAAKAQSPGLKAYDLYLIDRNLGGKISFFRAILRYIVFLVSFGLLFGILIAFLRKDGLMLHDLLTKSVIVEKI